MISIRFEPVTSLTGFPMPEYHEVHSGAVGNVGHMKVRWPRAGISEANIEGTLPNQLNREKY